MSQKLDKASKDTNCYIRLDYNLRQLASLPSDVVVEALSKKLTDTNAKRTGTILEEAIDFINNPVEKAVERRSKRAKKNEDEDDDGDEPSIVEIARSQGASDKTLASLIKIQEAIDQERQQTKEVQMFEKLMASSAVQGFLKSPRGEAHAKAFARQFNKQKHVDDDEDREDKNKNGDKGSEDETQGERSE